MGFLSVARFLLEAAKKDLMNLLNRKDKQISEVFIDPMKHSVCLPIEKIVADSKVSRKGVKVYKEKIKNRMRIDPIIVVKHPNIDKYAVLDGHHRYYAYLEMGKKEIESAIAGDYSQVIFYLTKNGYLQPSVKFTQEIRNPAKKLHENLKEFLEDFSKEG